MDVVHILRGDKYVLLSIGRVGCVDLKRDFDFLNGLDPSETIEKSLTIILMAMRRLTASMNTSNSSVPCVNQVFSLMVIIKTYQGSE
jgi:hypothetical protein